MRSVKVPMGKIRRPRKPQQPRKNWKAGGPIKVLKNPEEGMPGIPTKPLRRKK